MTTNQSHSEPEHTYGCAFKQRGAECDCGFEEAIGDGLMWRQRFIVGTEPTRGIDYSRYTAAEGINEGEDE